MTVKVAQAPGAWPLLGHAVALRRRPLEFLNGLPAVGNLVRIRLGLRPAYVLCDPALVHQVLTDSRTFDKGGPLFDKVRLLLGDGLGTCPYGPHQRQRRMMQPAFHHTRLSDYAAVMSEEITAATAGWREGQVIDADAEMFEIAMRVLTRTMFATEANSHAVDVMRDSLQVVFEGVYSRTVAPFGFVERFPLPVNRRYQQAIERIHAFVADAIREYRRTGADHSDMLSKLLAARDADGGTLSDGEIHDQIMTVLAAGTAATSATMAWAFHALGAHPELETQLHGELDTVLGGRPATWDDLPRLGLSSRIITETLRLYSPAWMFTRITTAETKLAGHPLPQGTVILYSSYLLQHRADIYPQPEHFDPSRWLPPAPAPPRGAFVPFGSGARKCIGDSFATTEVVMALASIAAHWRLIPLPDYQVLPVPRIALRPSSLPMRLVRRS